MKGRNAPLAIALAALALALSGLAAASYRAAGRPLYLLDDAYIHLTLARTLAADGTWGLFPGEPSSGSSSILWPLLLLPAAFAPAFAAAAPALLSAVAAALLLVRVDARLRELRPEPGGAARAAFLLLVLFGGALPTLVLSGMEHVLHALAALLLLERIVAAAEGEEAPLPLALAGAFATAVRYESVFLVVVGSVLLVSVRRLRAALALSAGALVPPLLFAAFSVSQGLPPVPGSVLAKSWHPGAGGSLEAAKLLGGRSVRNLLRAPHLLALVAAVALRLALVRPSRPARAAALVFLGSALLHAQLAAVGWLHRYEAYLLPSGLLALAALLVEGEPRGRPARVALRFALAAVVAAFLHRGVVAVLDVPVAAHDRLRKHVLPAEVLAGGSFPAVVVNDVGLPAWLLRARVLDLAGLASRDLRFIRRDSALSPDEVDHWARAAGARVAVLQTDWELVRRRLPASWIAVERWTLPPDRVFGDRRLTFFAIDPAAEPELRSLLDRARGRLPPDVEAARL